MIDLHSHILWAVDDGPRMPAGSLAMARTAVADGIRTVVATPHVRADHQTSADTMLRRVESLQEALRAEEIELEIRPGGELALDWLPELSARELQRFGLGGNPAYLLVEMPYTGYPSWLAQRILDLAATGVTPVLAHPERNAEVQAAPERLRGLVERGMLVQLTAASLDGRGGRASQECGQRLLDLGLAHVIASDAHEASIREIGLARAAEAVGDEALGRWLTVDMPRAIISRTALPSRPNHQAHGRKGGVHAGR